MSLFGEIVEPGTRTTWEDWDDAATENHIPELKWQSSLDIPEAIDLFLIFDGKSISDSINIYSQDSIDLVTTVKEASLSLYKVKLRNVFICVLKNYNLLLSSEIVELLRSFITNSKDVIVLLSKPVAEYQTSTILNQSCVVRSLCTSKCPINSYSLTIPKLEQPNIISGVAAGVVTLREHLKLPATAIIYYLEYSENGQMMELHNLLQNLDISFVSITVPSTLNNSNLYI